MQQSNHEIDPYQTDEIDLGKVAKLLKERRWFILGFTGIVTLLAIVYALSLPPSPYVSITSVVSPSQSSVLSLNKFPFTSETSETIFISYLRKLSEKEFQEKVFYENDYLTTLNPENESINDVEDYV
jgi:LPS O-antigen subunit length determinant protein (WzzB/FepE family)